MKKYIQIEEYCGHEGESWSTFLVKEGNEKAIQKLKEAIDKYDYLQDNDNFLTIKNDDIEESEVDIVVKYSTSGYYDTFTKCDKILNVDNIKTETDEEFVDSFYKKKLF